MARAPEGFAAFLVHVVRTVVFPLAFMQAMGIARRHTDDDPNGPKKVAVAIVLGLLLAAGGAGGLLAFREGAVDGAYNSLENRLSLHVGNEQYKEYIESARAHGETLTGTIQKKIDEARAEGNTSKEALWVRNRDNTIRYQEENLTLAQGLLPNHDVFLAMQDALASRDAAGDERANQILKASPATFETMDQTDADFAIKDKAIADMDMVLVVFMWPALIGLLYAPLVFALGGVLGNAYEPSETVGYKRYPSKSMGLFLVLGGFGWPSLLFSAWTLQDFEVRSVVGQISL